MLSTLPVTIIGVLVGVLFGMINRNLREIELYDPQILFHTKQRIIISALKEELATIYARYRKRILVLSALFLGAVVASDLGTKPEQPVKAFAYVYDSGASSGIRMWHVDDLGHWHERAPDGHEARLFDVTTRGVIDGCQGSLTRESRESDFLFFIPDVGCRTMSLMLKRGRGPWSALGPMSIVSSQQVLDE